MWWLNFNDFFYRGDFFLTVLIIGDGQGWLSQQVMVVVGQMGGWVVQVADKIDDGVN